MVPPSDWLGDAGSKLLFGALCDPSARTREHDRRLRVAPHSLCRQILSSVLYYLVLYLETRAATRRHGGHLDRLYKYDSRPTPVFMTNAQYRSYRDAVRGERAADKPEDYSRECCSTLLVVLEQLNRKVLGNVDVV